MEIQQANWITRARKAAGAKGPAQVSLLEDVNQMTIVANLDTPEFDWLGGVLDFVATAVVAPVAAQFTQFSLFNPAGSGMLAYLTKVELRAGAPSDVQDSRLDADTALAVINNIQPTDFRTPRLTTTQSILIGRAAAAAALPAGIVPLTTFTPPSAGGTGIFDRSYIIPPGRGYFVSINTVNVGANLNFFWKERPAESGELGLGT